MRRAWLTAVPILLTLCVGEAVAQQASPQGRSTASGGGCARTPEEAERQLRRLEDEWNRAGTHRSYNCIDCHGADGSGAMGPSLADGRWHFGGGPAEVFESIYQGRPDGMPAWGGRIVDDQIWMLVTYVRALSAGRDVSTETFTGRTVERTGH